MSHAVVYARRSCFFSFFTNIAQHAWRDRSVSRVPELAPQILSCGDLAWRNRLIRNTSPPVPALCLSTATSTSLRCWKSPLIRLSRFRRRSTVTTFTSQFSSWTLRPTSALEHSPLHTAPANPFPANPPHCPRWRCLPNNSPILLLAPRLSRLSRRLSTTLGVLFILRVAKSWTSHEESFIVA